MAGELAELLGLGSVEKSQDRPEGNVGIKVCGTGPEQDAGTEGQAEYARN